MWTILRIEWEYVRNPLDAPDANASPHTLTAHDLESRHLLTDTNNSTLNNTHNNTYNNDTYNNDNSILRGLDQSDNNMGYGSFSNAELNSNTSVISNADDAYIQFNTNNNTSNNNDTRRRAVSYSPALLISSTGTESSNSGTRGGPEPYFEGTGPEPYFTSLSDMSGKAGDSLEDPGTVYYRVMRIYTPSNIYIQSFSYHTLTYIYTNHILYTHRGCERYR